MFSKTIKPILFIVGVVMSMNVDAKVKSEEVIYKDGDVEMQGFVFYDAAKAAKHKLPGVVVVHDWMGVGDYVKMRAEQLAEMGYVAFVADIYGVKNRPQNVEQAAKIATEMRSGDRVLLRKRAKLAYDELMKSKYVDTHKVSATGYCFGGSTVLEMARMGLDLKGVVSFHGGLSTAKPEDAKNIKAKVLALHGAIDPYVPPAEVAAFEKEMNDAKVDYQFVIYSGAVHAFTQKQAGNDITKGAAYNEMADKRSFIAAKNFLEEVNK